MSIKKKFATAVATASLLAGLFGSAFVPSAMGAIVVSPDAVIPRYTTLNEGSDVQDNAAGTAFGFFSDDSDDVTASNDASIGIELFIDGAAGVGTTRYDFETNRNDSVQLKAVSSNANVNIGWAYNSGPSAGDCVSDATFGTSTTVVDVDSALDFGGQYYLCLAGETATTAATSTITVTVNGVVAKTFTVTAIGPVASITASLTGGYKYLAEGNDILSEWLTVIAKDAAGVQINGASSSISHEDLDFDDADTNPDNQQGDFMGFFTGSSGGGHADGDPIGSGTALIGYDVEQDVCAEESGANEDDGDAGNSYTLKLQDQVDTDVYSNGITITCTLGGVGARLTTATVEATSGADEYEDDDTGEGNQDQVSFFATIVDANGAPLGDGAGLDDDGLNFDLEFSGDSSLEEDIKYGRDATSGLFLMAAIKPNTSRFGRFTYTITAGDSDYNVSQVNGDDPVAKTYTFTYTAINPAAPVTITKVRNAAKTTAVFTADMGETSAFEIVYFTVEKANGTNVEYARRANGVGVATLTLNRRNTTIYVYASELDDTDVIKCVFR